MTPPEKCSMPNCNGPCAVMVKDSAGIWEGYCISHMSISVLASVQRLLAVGL